MENPRRQELYWQLATAGLATFGCLAAGVLVYAFFDPSPWDKEAARLATVIVILMTCCFLFALFTQWCGMRWISWSELPTSENASATTASLIDELPSGEKLIPLGILPDGIYHIEDTFDYCGYRCYITKAKSNSETWLVKSQHLLPPPPNLDPLPPGRYRNHNVMNNRFRMSGGKAHAICGSPT